MKIALFGATGRVGNEILRKASADGIHVKALVRTPDKLNKNDHLEIIQGDATNKEDIRKTIEGCDLVFSGLSTDRTHTLSTAIPYIIQSMEDFHVKRIVTIGTAGILNSRLESEKFRFQTNESKRKQTFAAEEHAQVFLTLSDTNLDWTIVCPTYLPDGDKQGKVRFEKNYLPIDGKKITVGDTAEFAYKELYKKEFNQTRVGICY